MGFNSIVDGHDARLCAQGLVEFAKGALAHSRTVKAPPGLGQAVEVSIEGGFLAMGLKLLRSSRTGREG